MLTNNCIKGNAIVLHEDKKYYASAEEVYPGVETLVQDEDTQPLTQPIIAPIKTRKFEILEANLPETTYNKEFLVDIMTYPEIVRNIVLLGHLSHGKTTLMDMFVEQTHPKLKSLHKEVIIFITCQYYSLNIILCVLTAITALQS